MNFTKTLTALSIAAGLACSISAQNLLENASFEDGLKGWKTLTWKPGNRTWLIPTIDKTTSQGLGGMHSMRMDYTIDKVTNIYYSKVITLPADMKELTISFWAKSEGYTLTTKGQCFVQVRFLPDVKKTFGVTTPWNKLQKKWTFFSKDFKIPADYGRKIQVIIGLHGNKNPKGTHWIDNIYVGPKQGKTQNQTAKKEITK